MPRLVRTALALALCMATSLAEAETSPEALATELFNAGRELIEQGRWEEARAKLTESARLDLQVGTLARLAECEERLGQLTSARAHWQQALNLARSQGDERQAAVAVELARVDREVPKLVLLPPKGAPVGLVIRIDDTEVGSGTLGTPVPVDPGEHLVALDAPGHRPWSRQVKVGTGEVSRIALPSLARLVTTTTEPRPVPKPAPVAPPSGGGSSSLPALGLATAGLGAVSLGVGVYFAGVAKSKLDLSHRVGCRGNVCTPEAAEVREESRTAGDLATGFLVAGSVLAAGGITLVLLAPSREPGPAAAFELAPAGARVRGSF